MEEEGGGGGGGGGGKLFSRTLHGSLRKRKGEFSPSRFCSESHSQITSKL